MEKCWSLELIGREIFLKGTWTCSRRVRGSFINEAAKKSGSIQDISMSEVNKYWT